MPEWQDEPTEPGWYWVENDFGALVVAYIDRNAIGKWEEADGSWCGPDPVCGPIDRPDYPPNA